LPGIPAVQGMYYWNIPLQDVVKKQPGQYRLLFSEQYKVVSLVSPPA
jgi:hypothetical protein